MYSIILNPIFHYIKVYPLPEKGLLEFTAAPEDDAPCVYIEDLYTTAITTLEIPVTPNVNNRSHILQLIFIKALVIVPNPKNITAHTKEAPQILISDFTLAVIPLAGGFFIFNKAII